MEAYIVNNIEWVSIVLILMFIGKVLLYRFLVTHANDEDDYKINDFIPFVVFFIPFIGCYAGIIQWVSYLIYDKNLSLTKIFKDLIKATNNILLWPKKDF